MIIAPDETSAQRTGVQTITFGVGSTAFGLILVASTSQGICAVLLGSSQRVLIGQLRSAFPMATLRDGQREFGHILNSLVHHVETPTIAPALSLDVHGTSFQKRVWNALRDIPVGQTATYKEIALKVGATAQEIGEVCAANCLAVLIPCHRVIRSDGGLGGYRWGTDRKRLLLAREQELSPDPESLFNVPGFAKILSTHEISILYSGDANCTT